MTRDQTMGAFLVADRTMSEQQAERAGLNDVLASALGAADMTPVVRVLELEPGDVLLLCTDGLTKHLSEPQITAVLDGAVDAETGCRRLVELALADGGRDNVTVIVVQVLGSA
jgi:protein phosphatase